MSTTGISRNFALASRANGSHKQAMFPVALFAAVLVVAIVLYTFSRRKALRAPGLREALLIIGTIIVLVVIWLTMMR